MQKSNDLVVLNGSRQHKIGQIIPRILEKTDRAKSSSWVALTRSPIYMSPNEGPPNH